jgi:hypothetical protein
MAKGLNDQSTDERVGDTHVELGSALCMVLIALLYVNKIGHYHLASPYGVPEFYYPHNFVVGQNGLFNSQNMVQFDPIGLCPRSREPCDGSQRLVACFNTYIIRFKPMGKPKPNSSQGSPTRKTFFWSRGSGMGFRGLLKARGVDV